MSWFDRFRPKSQDLPDLLGSILYNETTFYHRFSKDLLSAEKEVIIESPFITLGRLNVLKPVFEKLVSKNVKVFIVTKHPNELDEAMSAQAETGIHYFEVLGVQVLLCEGHHRKLAMIDGKILWEGSLNILSQSHSREFMRRIENQELTKEMFKFLKFDQVEFFDKKA